MTKQQRILFFGLGVAVGLVAVGHILQTRAEKKKISDERAAQSNIPGLLREYALGGKAVYGEGVMEVAVGPGAEGFAKTRRVLTGGRRRVDDSGRELPEDFLSITEYYGESGPLSDKTPVKRFDFAFADRIRVEVAKPEDTAKVFAAVKDLGGRLVPDPDSKTVVLVRFAKPKLNTVAEALNAVKPVPGVVSAQAIPIDWTKEIIK